MISHIIIRFKTKIENIQYDARHAITGAIGKMSKEKLSEKLGLESVQHRR